MNFACNVLKWRSVTAAVICASSVVAVSTAVQSGRSAGTQGSVITRIYSGADGQTHREDLDVTFSEASGAAVSKTYPATGLSLSLSGPTKIGHAGEWHTGPPAPKYSITLTGAIDIEIGGGEKIPVRPGTILLIEESTGKGHRNHSVSAEPRLTFQIDTTPLAAADLARPAGRTTTVMRVRQGATGDLRTEIFERQVTEVTRVSGFTFVRPGVRGWRTSHARQYMAPVRGRAVLIGASGAPIPVALGEVVLGESSANRALTIGCVESQDCVWVVFPVREGV